MIELDFTVPPQLEVGSTGLGGGHIVQVVVSASPAIFPDHDQYVSIELVVGKVVLAAEARVPRTEAAIDRWLDENGRKVGQILDRQAARRRKVLGR